MTEREKMVAGLPYDARDPELTAGRQAARAAMHEVDAEVDEGQRMLMLGELLGGLGDGTIVEAAFFCDYGTNVQIGRDCFFNVGVVILDSAPVTVGDRAQIGPGVQLLTADHPRGAAERAQGIEFAKPVNVGDDTWIGAGAILCPGVSIGVGSIVGAGSVVTRDVPAGCIAAGNPCRVIRDLPG